MAVNSNASIDKVDGQEVEWKTELRELSEVVDNFQLPVIVKVAHGFMITEEDALSAGTILTIHGKREVSKILAQDRLGRELHISLDNENKVEVIPSKYCTYNTIKDVCTADILPACIKNTIDFEFNKVLYPVDSSFLVNSVSKNRFGKRGLIVTDLSHEMKKLTLPYSVQGDFKEKIRPCDEDHPYLLKELLRSRKLPISVSFAQRSNSTTPISNLHASYTNVTLDKVYTAHIVYATSYIGDERHLITIPKDMEVKLRIGCRNDSQYSVIADAGYEPVAEDVLKCLLASNPYSGNCKTAIYESLEETVKEARKQIEIAQRNGKKESSTVDTLVYDRENTYTEAYPPAKEAEEANSYQPLASRSVKSDYQPLTFVNKESVKTYEEAILKGKEKAIPNEYSPEPKHSMIPPCLPPRPIKRHSFAFGSKIAGNRLGESKERTPPKIPPRRSSVKRNEMEKFKPILPNLESETPPSTSDLHNERSSKAVLGIDDVQIESQRGARREDTGNPLDSGSFDGDSKCDDLQTDMSSAKEQIGGEISEEIVPPFDIYTALCKLKLESFHAKFEENQIDMELLAELTEGDLVADLRMTLFQARKCLLHVNGWNPDEGGVWKTENETKEISHPPNAWSEKYVFENMMKINLSFFADFCKENQVNGELLMRILDQEMLQCIRDSYGIEISKIQEKKLSKFVFGGWRPIKVKTVVSK